MRYQIKYWGPDREDGGHDKGSASYEREGTAVRNFQSMIRSRRVRAPRSHVLLQDKDPGVPHVLARWDGCEADGFDALTVSEDLAERWDIT